MERTLTERGRRLPREERRVQLLTAAAVAFGRGGFDGTSMEDVAEAAGVTRLIVYRIFSSKEELYRAVLESVTSRLAEEFGGGDVPTYAARGGVSTLLLRVARERPAAFTLLWRHAQHEPTFAAEVAAFRDVSTEFAESLIHPFVRDRVFRRWAAAAVVAHLYEGVCAWLERGDPSRDDEFTARMGAGLRALVAAWSTEPSA
jgi:AcrR family transcriptional regulator